MNPTRRPDARARPTGLAVGPAERLQKVLARAGIGSRRAIEAWIRAGRITVNRQPAVLGQRVSVRDEVALDGRVVETGPTRPPVPRVWLLNKPAGTVCSRRDPEGRPTVYELLPASDRARFIAVGRLDFNTSGLLLFTNDGALAHRLMHPRYGIAREYAARIFGGADDAVLERLRTGIEIDGERLAFDALERQAGRGANEWFLCRLSTGRNREVRRMWEAQGCTVSRLIRVCFGPLQLPRRLAAGKCVAATPEELAMLYAAVGLALPSAEQPAPGRRSAGRPAPRATGRRR